MPRRRQATGPNAGNRGPHRLGIAVDEDHAATLPAKQHAGGSTYSAGASRYDDNFALKPSHASLHVRARRINSTLIMSPAAAWRDTGKRDSVTRQSRFGSTLAPACFDHAFGILASIDERGA
jgi:hypothetical protein